MNDLIINCELLHAALAARRRQWQHADSRALAQELDKAKSGCKLALTDYTVQINSEPLRVEFAELKACISMV